MSEPCCKFAEHLPAERLAALDAELQGQHRGFHKLAAAFGTNHTAIIRHKQKCLGIGRPEKGGTGAGTPEQARLGVPDVPEGLERSEASSPEHPPPRARAPVSAKEAGTQADRVAAIKLRIGDGALVPGDVPAWAEAWGLSERTVRAYVAEAYRNIEQDRGTVDERRILAMGKWEFQIQLCDEALSPKAEVGEKRSRRLSPMERALTLKERASAITGWCKAAGVFDDATKVTINLPSNPVFVAVTEALFQALAAFPEAHAAARSALAVRLQMLRQGPPAEVVTVAAEPLALPASGG
jgi:hypothetical protein